MWYKSIQENLESCVCQHYEEKDQNKNKIVIGPESVDDEANLDTADMMKRQIPALVMWYLPVINHLKCVVSNPSDAELVHWHSEKCRENDEEIRHPADGAQWKNFDLQYLEFSAESRKIRFALCTKGINPFGKNKTVNGTWSVILTMYKILCCLFLSKVQSKMSSIVMCSQNHSWKIW
jgi:hypothetical protein